MDKTLILSIFKKIKSIQHYEKVLKFVDFDENECTGKIQYNKDILDFDNSPSWYAEGVAQVHDEEMVRAWLVLNLYFKYGYNQKKMIAIEKAYKSVGHDGKGGRVDVLVKKKNSQSAFLFIECKAPDKYDEEIGQIDGQLFRLCRQEIDRPKFLLYYTAKLQNDDLSDRIILIDAEKYQTYEQWKDAGADSYNTIPKFFGVASKKLYANIDEPTDKYNILDQFADDLTFKQLNNEIHDVVWAGGGTSNNDIFVYIVKLLLCKIYDEQETNYGEVFRFQRLTDETGEVESSESTFDRMNVLFKAAETEYLALKENSDAPGFDKKKISEGKIAYVVSKLEGISLIHNKYSGDILGDFFENIVSQDFTQSRGQFFTPTKLIKFMIALTNCTSIAENIIVNDRDEQGRYRMPYIIDPSCGTGAFLIEYMRQITSTIGNPKFPNKKNNKIKENWGVWFGGDKRTNWAKEYLYAIEKNADLGLATKVNMVLHGDGCTNTWIENGLYPFSCYEREKATNVLGSSKKIESISYKSPINGGFDIILSNPPFSLKNNEDDKKNISQAFSNTFKLSEVLFIERWFQLLREGGVFCCILPENIMDTNTTLSSRQFLFKYFHLVSVVSLPYDAFKPFTSVKTCIVLARKKHYSEITEWERHFDSAFQELDNYDAAFAKTLSELNGNDTIFMAEPQSIGYKRRKNLPDLKKDNELYQEDENGDVLRITPEDPHTVLDYYYKQHNARNPQNLHLGFYVSVKDIVKRDTLRTDPKYNWLWVVMHGLIDINPCVSQKVALSNFVELLKLDKISKSELDEERELIDLDAVLPRTGTYEKSQFVNEIGSDKNCFTDSDILFSKLEPYLGKVIISPPQEAVGTTEWIGLRVKEPYKKNAVGFLLMHPKLCECYRMLQSGKRHARLDPEELLQLSVRIDLNIFTEELDKKIKTKEEEIKELQNKIHSLRCSIDTIYEETDKDTVTGGAFTNDGEEIMY